MKRLKILALCRIMFNQIIYSLKFATKVIFKTVGTYLYKRAWMLFKKITVFYFFGKLVEIITENIGGLENNSDKKIQTMKKHIVIISNGSL